MNNYDVKPKQKILAMASGGGHWVQLQRMRQAFSEFDTVYISTFASYSDQVANSRYYHVPDATRFNLLPFFKIFMLAARIIVRERPSAMITTGSAPMLVFLVIGRVMGCRTLWIDSIANSQRLSGSGRIARRVAHRVVSQWPEVAASEGVEYWGAIL